MGVRIDPRPVLEPVTLEDLADRLAGLVSQPKEGVTDVVEKVPPADDEKIGSFAGSSLMVASFQQTNARAEGKRPGDFLVCGWQPFRSQEPRMRADGGADRGVCRNLPVPDV